MRRCLWCTRKKRMQAVVDNCPERMDAAEAQRPPQIETAGRMPAEVEDTYPERMYAAVLTMRRCFWCMRKRRNKKKQEAAGEC